MELIRYPEVDRPTFVTEGECRVMVYYCCDLSISQMVRIDEESANYLILLGC
jgi:hypothetical protein